MASLLRPDYRGAEGVILIACQALIVVCACGGLYLASNREGAGFIDYFLPGALVVIGIFNTIRGLILRRRANRADS